MRSKACLLSNNKHSIVSNPRVVCMSHKSERAHTRTRLRWATHREHFSTAHSRLIVMSYYFFFSSSFFSQLLLLLLIVFIIGLHMKMTKIPIYIISAFESWNRHILPIAWPLGVFCFARCSIYSYFWDSFWIIIYN